MMSLLSVIELSAAGALCAAIPCSVCPPEGEECEVIEVRVQDGATDVTGVYRSAVGQGLYLPSVVYATDGQQESNSVVKVIIQNENGALQYADENGNVQVTHNGTPVSADRIQRDGGTVRILGPDGETIYEFRVGGRATGAWVLAGADGGHGQAMFTPAQRGRIGVYLSATDEAVRAENGIESETAVTILDVIEGSPAQEAGLAANDIVVRVNGQTASEESLRTIVAETEPGNEITLRIVRGGEPRDVKVRVGASEETQFDTTFQRVQADPAIEHFTIELDGLQERMGDIQDHLIQIAPEGQWRTHLEQLNEINPEMLEHLRQKFGEGQHFYQLHVQPSLQGHQQWIEHAGAHGEAIREKLLEALQNAELNLDDETNMRIHEAVTKALEGALSNMHNVEVQVEGADEPVLFDLMARGEGDHIMVLPEGGTWQIRRPADLRFEGALEMGATSEEGAADRLRRLEERLEKLEALLQQLVERQGGARLP